MGMASGGYGIECQLNNAVSSGSVLQQLLVYSIARIRDSKGRICLGDESMTRR